MKGYQQLACLPRVYKVPCANCSVRNLIVSMPAIVMNIKVLAFLKFFILGGIDYLIAKK